MVELSSEGDIRFATTFNKAYGGDTLNTAIAAKRLGSSVCFITRLAQDPFAFGLKELLMKEGLETRMLRSVPGFTGQYYTCVDENGNREFLYYRRGSAASTLDPDDIDPAMIASVKAVFASGITLALSASARKAVVKAFKLARKHNVFTVFDPNFRRSLWDSEEAAFDAMNEVIPHVDIILPSLPEDLASLSGFTRVDQVMDYFWFKDVKLVVAKAGGGGCYIGYKRKIEHLPALDVRPVDTTGAGDAFNGGFLHGLVNQQSLADCARLGIVTAGLKVQRRGCIKALPTREEVYSRMGSPSFAPMPGQ